MNEWGVVGVIAALLSIAAVVVPPVVRLNNSITKSNTILTLMQARYDKSFEENTEDHRRIHEKTSDLESRVEDHETRITLIEHDHARNHPVGFAGKFTVNAQHTEQTP